MILRMTLTGSMNHRLLGWLLCFHLWGIIESYSIDGSFGHSFFNPESSSSSLIFSLEKYQRECALEASQSLDASRLHFQILFVDDDNAKGRIAEGLLAKVAEHNDATSVLFPSSATISSSRHAPRDAAASYGVIQICHNLDLCPIRSEAMGTDFSLNYLNDYDLIICMSEEIQSLIVRSILDLEDLEYYRPRCRLLSDFLSPNFVTHSMNNEDTRNKQQMMLMRMAMQQQTDNDDVNNNNNNNHDNNHNNKNDNNDSVHRYVQWTMLDGFYQERVRPYLDQVLDRSSSLFATTTITYPGFRGVDPSREDDWSITEAGLILATGGITKFCLATIEAQMEEALDSLLELNVHTPDHIIQSWEDVDKQLCRCNHGVTGFFSPAQRKIRFERHLSNLKTKWDSDPPIGHQVDGKD